MRRSIGYGVLCGALGLVAMSARGQELTHDEMIQKCVEMNTELFRCRDAYLTALMNMMQDEFQKLPDSQRQAIRDVAAQQFTAMGSGPTETRRASCEQALSNPRARVPRSREMYLKVKACFEKADCEARATCVIGLARQEMAARHGAR